MKFWSLALAMTFICTAHAAGLERTLSDSEKALLDSVIRNCKQRDKYYRDDAVATQPSDRLALATDGGSSEYRHYYSPEMWRVIAAAARETQRLGWVVTDGYYSDSRLNGRVLSLTQYEELRAEIGSELKCMNGPDPIPMCDDTERRIGREIFGIELSPCGDEMPWAKDHPNALRPQHVRMITALLDNGYSYNPGSRAFEKTAGENEAQGAGATR